MTKFVGGPAHGKSLLLRRAPYFLRVVIGARGRVDALDQLYDVPREDESVYVYVLRGERTTVSVTFSEGGRGRRRRTYVGGDYVPYPHPPGDEATLRDNEAWKAWAVAEMRRIKDAEGKAVEAEGEQ